MEETISSSQFDEEGEEFHDALDDFEFFDCCGTFYDPIESNGDGSISESSHNQSPEEKLPPPANLRHRRSRSNAKSSGADSTESVKFFSSENVGEYLREGKLVDTRIQNEYDNNLEDSKIVSLKNEMNEEKSTVTDANAVACNDEPNSRGSGESNSGLLFTLAEYVYEWLKEQRTIWKLGLKCGWGLLWSAYVCGVLVGLLVSAFLMGGILIKLVVEEPIRMTRSLNFDYSEKSPVAFVPLMSNVKLNRDVHLVEKPEILKADGSRVVPRDHRMQVTVSLTMPESEYNQHLGIFQVRVDLLSADGQILTTSRSPCMLQYKSQPIRLLLTLLKVAPILTGYTSETQNLKVNFRDLTEGDTPTACLRVILEQRAEYSPGAGIPEIYSASLRLESQLPLVKRILWFWKKTLFVWVSMTVFMMELVFGLLCCRPLIIPKIRLWEPTPTLRDAHQTHT